jgi:cyanate permease
LGSALAHAVSGVMVKWGWQAALITSSIPALIIAIIWLMKRTPPIEPQSKIDSGGIVQVKI